MSDEKPTGLALLRVPFPAHRISKLPKPYKKDSPKGKCSECGGYHGLPAVHLDYVGHAALTDRLLDADPAWTWESVPDPVSLGLPLATGGMWIRLTVCGVSRFGYGHADGKTGGDAVKETIGDALRNAAMRFGAALDLWHKGQLHEDADEAEPVKVVPVVAPAGYDDWRMDFMATAETGLKSMTEAWMSTPEPLRMFWQATESKAMRDALKAKASAVDAKAAA